MILFAGAAVGLVESAATELEAVVIVTGTPPAGAGEVSVPLPLVSKLEPTVTGFMAMPGDCTVAVREIPLLALLKPSGACKLNVV